MDNEQQSIKMVLSSQASTNISSSTQDMDASIRQDSRNISDQQKGKSSFEMIFPNVPPSFQHAEPLLL
jgi:hypothetical protein